MYKDVYQLYREKRDTNPTMSDEEIDFLDKVQELAGESSIYEVGMDFGDRLLYLQNLGCNVYGGCEFDPMFAAYGQNLHQIYNHGLTIHSFYSVEDFHPIIDHEVVFTYHMLDKCSEPERSEIKNKIINSCITAIFYEDYLGGLVVLPGNRLNPLSTEIIVDEYVEEPLEDLEQ